MADVLSLTFNAFQENTYVVYDETGECVIFDPGNSNAGEDQRLLDTITNKGLKPVKLINTHCHIDHVFGNKFVAEQFDLPLGIHEGELPLLEAVPQISQVYGLPQPEPSPKPGYFIEAGETITFGNTSLLTLFTPGHSPASLCFYCEKDAFVIAGDVLFYGSIGRTDLPGGDYDTLINSVRTELFTLPDNVKVWPGHGPATTVGFEKQNNPFFQ
ncbi:MAG: MBL fold metallo-hydrolase [Bacteroidetes bacterium]|nr:MAG: MBL fold metallo-hydrolase [Bacteroidota bacterium]